MSAFGNLSGLGADAATHMKAAHRVHHDFVKGAQDAIVDAQRGDCKNAFSALLAAAEDIGIYQREAGAYSGRAYGHEAAGSARLYKRAKETVYKACIRHLRAVR